MGSRTGYRVGRGRFSLNLLKSGSTGVRVFGTYLKRTTWYPLTSPHRPPVVSTVTSVSIRVSTSHRELVLVLGPLTQSSVLSHPFPVGRWVGRVEVPTVGSQEVPLRLGLDEGRRDGPYVVPPSRVDGKSWGSGGTEFQSTESQGWKEVDLPRGPCNLGFSVESEYREGKEGPVFTERRNVRLSQK